MKLTDMIISAIIKRGIVYEGRNVDVEFDIPRPLIDPVCTKDTKIKIHFKAEHMTLKIDKEEA
jgi:hypothetical protein